MSKPAFANSSPKHPLLDQVGRRVREIRSRRGMTRKQLAAAAEISERHLANLESGVGNASILLLHQVAGGLRSSLVDLLGDITTSSPEWLLIREALSGREEQELHRVRIRLNDLLGEPYSKRQPSGRIALIGLRGAGKSTLGKMLADHLGYPFVELTREIEKLAGCSIGEIQALYGGNTYQRYEQKALKEVIGQFTQIVVATPGGLAADATALNVVLTNFTTVWLKADPEDHMQRVVDQGDLRPMAASSEAMDDLKGILAGREPFYSKADHTLDTSEQSLKQTFVLLKKMITPAPQEVSCAS